MSLHIDELCDPALLAAMVSGGYVRTQRHPSLPLLIYNYTEKAQYENVWNAATLACRGLVASADGTVVARPFTKFFNHGQPGAPELSFEGAVTVTDKADGCFPRGTALNLWGGGTITIDKVVRNQLPVTLAGMDESGTLVPTVVTGWHDNGRKDNWLDIEVGAPVSRVTGAGGLPNRLRVTTNHHIHVNGTYQPASEIKAGDLVITQTWVPSDEVLRLVRASLLGDGCLLASATKPGQARYQEPHAEKQADYVEALRKALGDCASNRANTRSGYGSTMVWAGSREYAVLGELRAEWYPDGGPKRVPQDLSWLDDFAVAKWLMDDGYRQYFKKQADRLAFATNSFPREDIVRLGQRLAEMYGVSYHIGDDSGRGLRLVVSSGRRQQIRNLWSSVAPHVHPALRYKLPEEYRDVPYIEMSAGREIAVTRGVAVRSVTPVAATKRNFPSGRTGYDITTTTKNYLARGVLVHNSLGVSYPTPGGWAIATRGSFDSEQARHATEVWRRRYASRFTPPAGLTVLFEIIYPGNRIVLDYGALDDLMLLGAVDTASGRSYGPSAVPGWPGPVVETFAYATLAEALAAPPRDNREGLVVHFTGPDTRLKIKYTEYVRLHRIVTGLNARVVWEAVVSGTLDELLEPLPDEFHAWATNIAAGLRAEVDVLAAGVESVYAEVVAGLPAGWTRKDFALAVARHPTRGCLFLRLDGKDYSSYLWQRVRPSVSTLEEAVA
jgi:RNA ligase